MRSLWRTLALASVLVVFLVPTMIYADDPTFFVSDRAISDEPFDGSGQKPYVAANAAAMRTTCEMLEEKLDEGQKATVYWVHTKTNEYYKYMITEGSAVCTPVGLGTAIDGKPSDFGVAMTSPLIIGGLIVLGVLLIGAAWILQRRRRAHARPA